MRVGVIYFGIIRSLDATIESIKARFVELDQNKDISFFFLSSLNLVRVIDNERSREYKSVVSYDQFPELASDYWVMATQSEQRTERFLLAAQQRKDPYRDGWASVKNLLNQLYALDVGWKILSALRSDPFDYYVFLRPDLHYLDDLDVPATVERFCGQGNVALPAWHGFGGFNDRFAIADHDGAAAYATRLHAIEEFCANKPLHAERLLAYSLQRAGCRVCDLPVRAIRMRASGLAKNEDFDKLVVPIPRAAARFRIFKHVNMIFETESGMDANSAGIGVAAGSRLGEIADSCRLDGGLGEVLADGHKRVSPLTGLQYLQFLKSFHNSNPDARYLEIGSQKGRSLECANGPRLAIDPRFRLDKEAWAAKDGVHLFEMTSDDFFERHDPSESLGGKIDIAFIDGMHLSEYVLRDFINVEKHCHSRSVVIFHDVVPRNHEMAERDRRPAERKDAALAQNWTGDVWRVVSLLRERRPDLRMYTLDCPPTGLLLITGLDPRSDELTRHLDEDVARLTAGEPGEEEFWDFIKGLDVYDSAKLARAVKAMR